MHPEPDDSMKITTTVSVTAPMTRRQAALLQDHLQVMADEMLLDGVVSEMMKVYRGDVTSE